MSATAETKATTTGLVKFIGSDLSVMWKILSKLEMFSIVYFHQRSKSEKVRVEFKKIF